MRGRGEGVAVIILYCGCWNVTTVLTKLFAHNTCCNASFTWVLLCWVSSPTAPAAPWPGRSTPPDIRSITCRWHIKILQTLTKYKIAQGKVRAPQTPGNLKEGLQPCCLLFFRLWPSDSQHNKRLNILCVPTLSCHWHTIFAYLLSLVTSILSLLAYLLFLVTSILSVLTYSLLSLAYYLCLPTLYCH